MEKLSERVISWTRDYLNSFGGKTKAVIGISGGKDSTIAAKICERAVGHNRVICVRLPQGEQRDIETARAVCRYLSTKSYEINIGNICVDLANTIRSSKDNNDQLHPETSPVYTSNTPARIRMTILYGIAAIIGDCRVVNTCNRSEDFIGYSTKFGDSAGDFSPLANLTVREVKQVGRELGVPEAFIEKAPEDGLSGKTDEENIGFTYDELDDFLLYGIIPKPPIMENIMRRHNANLHKIAPMPSFVKETNTNEA